MLTVLIAYRIYMSSFFDVIFVEIFFSSFTITYKRDSNWELSLSICSAHIEMLA